MSGSLTNQCEVHISGGQVRRQRVFEEVRIALRGWKPSGFGDCLKHPEELAA
jgi:hypothetical protein